MHLMLIVAALHILAAAAFAQPTTQPADEAPEWSLTPAKLRTIESWHLAYVQAETTFDAMERTINELLPKVESAVDSQTVATTGPIVFTYEGITMDPAQKFTLKIGVMVKQGSKAPEGFKIENTGQWKCASALYTGSPAHLMPAWQKFLDDVTAQGLRPTAFGREAYLFWEGPQSNNNVVMLQVRVE